MYKGQRWTLVHSHFLQMGGFKLYCTTKEKEAYIPSLGYISDIRFSQSKQNDKHPCDFCMRAKDSDDGSHIGKKAPKW